MRISLFVADCHLEFMLCDLAAYAFKLITGLLYGTVPVEIFQAEKSKRLDR